jgi:hypothetical protein
MMMRATGDLYATLEAEYSPGTSMMEHIEFEVTFMTQSLIDGNITIAAWANRTGRAPKSLRYRVTDPNFYDDTETARLYSDPNLSARYIESTDETEYKELYTGQKQRIKSSVIYPVADDRYTLLGTLVVHCDKVGFFKSEAQKFWGELLEPYTKRLALARALALRLRDDLGAAPHF